MFTHSDVFVNPIDAEADFSQFRKEQSKVIHLASLPYDVTQTELESWFSIQDITPIALLTIKFPDVYQKPSGSGFAIFSTHEDAKIGLEMNGKVLCDRIIEVNPSSDRVIEAIGAILSSFPTCGQLLDSQFCDAENTSKILPIRNTILDWNAKTFIMGIINVVPYGFGLFTSADDVANHAEKLMYEGADIIDICGISTKSNGDVISVEEEISCVIPIIKAIKSKKSDHVIISINTFRSEVARKAIETGADLINDISGFTQYDDVISEINNELYECVQNAIESGVKCWNIIVGPGIGFAKNYEQNYEILRRLKEFNGKDSKLKGFPCLVRLSSEDFIESTSNKKKYGTAAVCAASIAGGANIIRVHDVVEMAVVSQILTEFCIWYIDITIPGTGSNNTIMFGER
ncbi:1076_t:CDS:2 [Entrophospora sp. SA101]|nr:1076_t:CDS:2 [Entrophospora sp. SA101]